MRQTAKCLWLLAVDKKMDANVFKPYTDSLFEDTYINPFRQVQEETGETIVENLLKGGG